jgi:hypothetical protein
LKVKIEKQKARLLNMSKTPSMKEWQRLYDVALEFKKLESWNRM